MRKLLMGSAVLLVFSFAIIIFQVACTKKSNGSPDDTTPPTKEEILVAKTWKVDKLHHVISNKYSSYTDGGANTTGVSYDKLRFTFNANGTGSHTNENGITENITWQFTSADKRALNLTFGGITYTCDMVELADKYLHASVNLSVEGNSNNIETFRLIQLP